MIDSATIKAKLDGDATLAALLSGQIWDRGIKSKGPGATTEAFTPGAGTVLPCAVVSPIQATRDLNGPPTAFSGTATIWLKSHDTSPNRAALESAAERIVELLDDEWLVDAGGGLTETTFTEVFGIRADPMITGDLFGYVRFSLAGVRS